MCAREEGRGEGRVERKGKRDGEQARRGESVEERESKLWIETGRTERERESGWWWKGWSRWWKSGVCEKRRRRKRVAEGRKERSRTCDEDVLEGVEREREKVEERPVSSSRQWRRVSPSRGGEVRKNGGGGK